MSLMPSSPLSGNASRPHHLDAVVFLRVVRRRDLRAAVVPVARDGEIQHVGPHHPVVDDVGALAPWRPSMNAAATDGDDSRMSRETAIRLALE